MTRTNLRNRTIFCRDNIDILQGINSNSIDLIYLDPPFSKNDTFITKKNKNIEKIKNFFIEEQQKYNRFSNENFEEIFKDNSASFSDIWTENDINEYYYTEIDKYNNQLVSYLDSIKNFAIKGGFYYLLYMTVRLIEMKRILKDTGSIYYHCDPTFSHYIKVVMDRIFGVDNFISEIIWNYGTPSGGRVGGKKPVKSYEVLLSYAKNYGSHTYNKLFTPYNKNYTEAWFRHIDEDDRKYRTRSRGGKIIRQYLDESPGVPLSNTWTDIKQLYGSAGWFPGNQKEITGYPTQKPLALLERIIQTSSKEEDIVLDPFCGCATTCIASEKLNRQWIGIDWNKQSFYMIYYRAYLMDILGTEYDSSLFNSGIIQETNTPQRTDISQEELNKIQKEYQNKQEIKRTKKIRMSTEDKVIAKELLYEEQTGMCNGCDVYMRSVELTIDHITPQSKEGDDNLDNLQLLCHRCNNWKRDKSMKFLFDKLFDEKIISLGTYNKQVAKLKVG